VISREECGATSSASLHASTPRPVRPPLPRSGRACGHAFRSLSRTRASTFASSRRAAFIDSVVVISPPTARGRQSGAGAPAALRLLPSEPSLLGQPCGRSLGYGDTQFQCACEAFIAVALTAVPDQELPHPRGSGPRYRPATSSLINPARGCRHLAGFSRPPGAQIRLPTPPRWPARGPREDPRQTLQGLFGHRSDHPGPTYRPPRGPKSDPSRVPWDNGRDTRRRSKFQADPSSTRRVGDDNNEQPLAESVDRLGGPRSPSGSPWDSWRRTPCAPPARRQRRRQQRSSAGCQHSSSPAMAGDRRGQPSVWSVGGWTIDRNFRRDPTAA
jgi:hypothetical protein